MEIENPTTMICTLTAIDESSLCYRVCSLCEKTLPENPNSLCNSCTFGSSKAKRLFRILMSVASDTKVFTAVCFDRAAKALFGCSADEFFDFAKIRPFAARASSEILVGEMMKVTLARPKSGNAQHLRLSQVVPLRSGFRPAIETLKEIYGVTNH